MNKKYFISALAVAMLGCTATKAQDNTYKYYNPLSVSGSNYKAQKVIMNVGMSGVNISMKLLGETRGGYQVWYCNNYTGKYAYGKFQIDNGVWLGFDLPYEGYEGSDLPPLAPRYDVADSTAVSDTTAVEDTTSLTMTIPWRHMYVVNPYGSTAGVNVKSGSQYVHFAKVVDQNFLFYAYCNESDGILQDLSGVQRPINEGFYIEPKIDITLDNPVFVEANNRYAQTVRWNISGLTNEMFYMGSLSMSTDDGATWTSECSVNVLSGSAQINIPWKSNGHILYQMVLYPKDKFKYLVRNGYWQSEAVKSVQLSSVDIPCSVSIQYGKTNFADDDDYAKRTYSPTVTWAMPYNMVPSLSNLSIEYRPCNAIGEWRKLADLNTQSGTKAFPVPVGYDSLQFRLVAKSKAEYTLVKSVNTSEAVLATTTYEPSFSAVVVKDSVCDEATNTLNVTLNYLMNDDLWQTRLGSADVYYSTDGGNKWTLANTLGAPSQSGTVQLVVPAGAGAYQFRMGIMSSVNNQLSYCTKTANHDTTGFGDTSSINSATADGQQPMRVYNLNGVYLGDTTIGLPTGVYIVNGKKYIVK